MEGDRLAVEEIYLEEFMCSHNQTLISSEKEVARLLPNSIARNTRMKVKGIQEVLGWLVALDTRDSRE